MFQCPVFRPKKGLKGQKVQHTKNSRVRVSAFLRAWPWARALAHLGVGLVLGVWGVCGRGPGVCACGSKFLVFGFFSLVFFLLKSESSNPRLCFWKVYFLQQELHNLIRGTFGVDFGIASRVPHNKQRTANPQSWHISRHHRHLRVRMHRGLLDNCPTWRRRREWAAIFLTAAKETFWPGKAPAIGSLCRCHCHLQCFDTQLDPISVRGLSQYFSSSCLLFLFS